MCIANIGKFHEFTWIIIIIKKDKIVIQCSIPGGLDLVVMYLKMSIHFL